MLVDLFIDGALGSSVAVLLATSLASLLPYYGFMNMETSFNIQTVVERLFMPCLIFSNIIKAHNFNTLYTLIPCVVLTLLVVPLGQMIASVSNKLFIKEKKLDHLTIFACSFPQTTNLLILLAGCLSPVFAKHLNLSVKSTDDSMYPMIALQSMIINSWRIHKGRIILPQLNQSLSQEIEMQALHEHLVVNQVQERLKFDWFNPLHLAGAASLACILFSRLEDSLLSLSFFHSSVYVPIDVLGKANTPTTFVALGSTLYFLVQASHDTEFKSQIIKINLIKLIVTPSVGLVVTWIMRSFIDNRISQFMLFAQFLLPTTLGSLRMSQRFAPAAEPLVAYMLLSQYCIFFLTLPIWLSLYFYLFL